ncbi:HK97 family phage prohead protease [Enterococcus sp. BWM-S5]|uniref:HK97 family phage prohead protease n=1 Tax=Enterococcus larvae TaxID=2794352 RepID=A0ABS4CED3_9ENTE|nr:HK97 family phage prohead protease [Enterococcus larvae]MBP1044852.1 HK97 family phage prohead protease [Enterococcus larvae]
MKIKTGTKEIRQTTTTIELRNDPENQTDYIEGYALKFNRMSELLGGWFREKIAPEALKDTDISNVTALFNHEESKILGRSGINLEIEIDAIGLRFRVKPTKTSYSADLLENIRQGIVNQCSFAFTVSSDPESEEWEQTDKDGAEYIRTIRRINKIYDVSIVTTPAYSDTEAVIGSRSRDQVEQLERKKLNTEIELLKIEAEAYS